MTIGRKTLALLLIAFAMVGPALSVGAQKPALDPAADPNYGTWPLANFPDPFVMTLMAGGDVDASASNVGSGCVGFVTASPDLRFDFAGGPLRAFFASAGDTTLILYLPDGTYQCNDDGAGTNPVIELDSAPDGTYALWIGTFNQDVQPGHLVLTSGSSQPGALASPLLTGGPAADPARAPSTDTPPTASTADLGALNPAAEPTFGLVELEPGFLPDPVEVALTAGGSVDVRALGLAQDCTGFVAAPPDVRVSYGAAGGLLRVFVESLNDTTLVIRLPDGSFVCNDDFGGFLDPVVDIPNPAAGLYDIWVGTQASGTLHNGTVIFTNSDSRVPANF